MPLGDVGGQGKEFRLAGAELFDQLPATDPDRPHRAAAEKMRLLERIVPVEWFADATLLEHRLVG